MADQRMGQEMPEGGSFLALVRRFSLAKDRLARGPRHQPPTREKDAESIKSSPSESNTTEEP